MDIEMETEIEIDIRWSDSKQLRLAEPSRPN